MPPGNPHTGCVALPPRISVIRCPYARCFITSLATSMPAFSMTPRMLRFQVARQANYEVGSTQIIKVENVVVDYVSNVHEFSKFLCSWWRVDFESSV